MRHNFFLNSRTLKAMSNKNNEKPKVARIIISLNTFFLKAELQFKLGDAN